MAQPTLPPLATPADVATALGVDDVSALPNTMQVRMDVTLNKVSRRFRKEAQRVFTPGVYTHVLRIHAGAARLMEVPNQIIGVRIAGLREYDWDSGALHGIAEGEDEEFFDPPPDANSPALQWFLQSNWLHWADWGFWRLNGRQVEVTYSWDTPVPDHVVTAVADIVGRNLSVDPLSALAQSKSLSSHNHKQELADWVADGATGFTRDDIAQARSYRYPAPPVIVATMAMVEMSPSQAFLSDSSW